MLALPPTLGGSFGPLQPLHTYILAHAQPLTVTNWYNSLVIPVLPLAAQCYLVQFDNTRPWRIACGVLGLVLFTNALVSYRFSEPQHNAYNNAIGIGFLHVLAKYAEFALVKDKIVDPYLAKGRSRLIAAVDLAANSRMVGVRPISLDDTRTKKREKREEPNGRHDRDGKGSTKKDFEPDGAIEVAGQSIPRHSDRWLPYPKIERTKSQAVRRHLTLFLIHFTSLDTLGYIIRHFGKGDIGEYVPPPHALRLFLRTKAVYVLPRLFPMRVPAPIMAVITELLVGVAVWQGLLEGFHFFGFVCVASGLWEVGSFEVDFMDQPWKSESMLELWGKRYHQFFRHHFLLASTLILRTLGLSPNHWLLFPLIFFFSGSMHALGQIPMDPVPNPIRLLAFFLLSGIGCALEILFRKVSGKRVGGLAGRLWAWTWMLGCAAIVAEPWLDAGIGAAALTPRFLGPAAPGPIVGGAITRWLIDLR